MPEAAACLFCRIARKDVAAYLIEEDEHTLSFLDHRPLFVGHVLVVPRVHYETLVDLPSEEIAHLFGRVKAMARAVEIGLGAEGSFVAANNRVSQSVPHLHVHVVPRRPKDGLKGFFWPRRKYDSEAEALATVASLQRALGQAAGEGAR